ncbi:hypothetical protein NLJ89_g1705 [Agrocybe chaxingu]|uniref:Dynein light chain n=1 Tax=Agrocybe chaxingu TaxID=84603 RepID=A0A9W8MZI7_9AGAR|nr:hypothetical protein NLJ89_g1705 [Agrocybe chaxingu]
MEAGDWGGEDRREPTDESSEWHTPLDHVLSQQTRIAALSNTTTGQPPSIHFTSTMADKVDAPTSSTDTGSTKDALTGASPKAIIKNVDMSEEMQQESVDIASAALEKYNIEKDIAAQIKKEFDRRHGPTWHVVVGKNFGSYVTHETKHFIYFYVGNLAILIWKS